MNILYMYQARENTSLFGTYICKTNVSLVTYSLSVIETRKYLSTNMLYGWVSFSLTRHFSLIDAAVGTEKSGYVDTNDLSTNTINVQLPALISVV